MNYFALSSPDMYSSPFINDLVAEFATVISAADGPGDTEVGALHSGILAHAQKAWYQRFPDQLDLTSLERFRAQANATLNQLNDNPPWLIHDPLLCHFFALWKPLVDHPVVLLHYSEPLECAIALQRKWRFPLNVGLALWESYMLAACQQLDDKNCVLISSAKLRRSGRRHLRAVYAKLAKLSGGEIRRKVGSKTETELLTPDLDEACADQQEHVQKSQQRIFDALEKGQFKRLGKMQLSTTSIDTLDYYGRLRAGFEKIRAGADSRQMQPRNPNIDAGPTEPMKNDDQASPLADTAEQNLCVVNVLLKGMAPLEFVTEVDSPVLSMLQQQLIAEPGAADELIFLNSVGSDSEAIYFMASSLLAVETEPV